MLIFGVAAITVRSNGVITESGVKETSLCVFCETSIFYPWILLALHPNADLRPDTYVLALTDVQETAGLNVEHRLNHRSIYWPRTTQKSIGPHL